MIDSWDWLAIGRERAPAGTGAFGFIFFVQQEEAETCRPFFFIHSLSSAYQDTRAFTWGKRNPIQIIVNEVHR